MTKLLEKAFDEACKLPRWEQDAIAAMVLEEIADNQRWKRDIVQSRRLSPRQLSKILSTRGEDSAA